MENELMDRYSGEGGFARSLRKRCFGVDRTVGKLQNICTANLPFVD
jgi:hypothetical protein